MSAYALFPPVVGSCSSQPNHMNSCVSSPSYHFSEEKQKSGGIGHFSLASVLSIPTEQAGKEEIVAHTCSTEVPEYKPTCTVKEAKIDPVRLVQAVTAGSKIGKREAESSHCEQRRPNEDAIQFELSISFNGRSYSATRTLPRIMELRRDLIRELSCRRKRLQNRRMRWSSLTNVNDYDGAMTNADNEEDIFIPEIPKCDTDSVAVQGGVAGRGFAMLQALLGPYCPAIERWLQNVMDLVPPTTSSSLSAFLWEPVSVDNGSRCGMMRSSSSLERIAEDVDSEEGECER